MNKTDFERKINSKEYNEPFAQQLLALTIDNDLKNSTNNDRPDIWYGDNYGIEVTTLTDTYYKTLNRYKPIWSSKNMTLEQIIHNQPLLLQGKIGINKHGNLIILKTTDGKRTVAKGQKGIASTVAMKLQKLQHYKIFDRNDLFIFAPNLHVACTPAKIQQSIANIEQLTNIEVEKFQYKYDNIFVYTYDKLISIPFNLPGAMRVIEVNDEIRNICNRVAMPKLKAEIKRRDEKHKKKKEHSNNIEEREMEE